MLHGRSVKNKNHNQSGRASAFIPKGSLSVEASFAAPFFMLAMLCILYLFEMIYVETAMRNAFYSAARQMAKEAYVSSDFPGARLYNLMQQELGEKRLVEKIDCSGSRSYGNSNIMDLEMRYQLEIPVFLFQIPLVEKEEHLRIKGWTGYGDEFLLTEKEDVVYITDTGMVYHSTPSCNYLDLSIRRESLQKAQEQYNSCSLCGKEPLNVSFVYVTTYGTAYHSSLNCSGLKRNIYAVKKSEIHGKGGCSKCVK